MLNLKDENGNVVPGLLKDNRGAIVVKNDAEYQRYMIEKKRQETINNLTQEVSELKDIVNQLITSLNKNCNQELLEKNNG